jgi:hypothetical protein
VREIPAPAMIARDRVPFSTWIWQSDEDAGFA